MRADQGWGRKEIKPKKATLSIETRKEKDTITYTSDEGGNDEAA